MKSLLSPTLLVLFFTFTSIALLQSNAMAGKKDCIVDLVSARKASLQFLYSLSSDCTQITADKSDTGVYWGKISGPNSPAHTLDIDGYLSGGLKIGKFCTLYGGRTFHAGTYFYLMRGQTIIESVANYQGDKSDDEWNQMDGFQRVIASLSKYDGCDI